MNDEQRKLVEAHMGLVGKTIALYYKQHLSNEDIYQIGCMGLIKAAINYDRLDMAFSTYAVPRIRSDIGGHFREIGRIKRKSNFNTKSMYERVPGTKDIEFYETLVNDTDFTDKVLIDIALQSVFKQLDCREQKILRWYLKGYTFREMSSQIGVSQSNAFRIFYTKIKPLLKEVVA